MKNLPKTQIESMDAVGELPHGERRVGERRLKPASYLAAQLHSTIMRIMNLIPKVEPVIFAGWTKAEREAFKLGHKYARHDAAELVSEFAAAPELPEGNQQPQTDSGLDIRPSAEPAGQHVAPPLGWRDVIQNARDSICAGGFAENAQYERSIVEPHLDGVYDELAELESAATAPAEQPSNPTPRKREILAICDAYESGIGHGLQRDGHSSGAIWSDPECGQAYELGYAEGLGRSEPEARIVGQQTKGGGNVG